MSQADLLDKVSNVLAICELRAKGNGLTGIFQLSLGPRDVLHCCYLAVISGLFQRMHNRWEAEIKERLQALAVVSLEMTPYWARRGGVDIPSWAFHWDYHCSAVIPKDSESPSPPHPPCPDGVSHRTCVSKRMVVEAGGKSETMKCKAIKGYEVGGGREPMKLVPLPPCLGIPRCSYFYRPHWRVRSLN